MQEKRTIFEGVMQRILLLTYGLTTLLSASLRVPHPCGLCDDVPVRRQPPT